MTLLTQLETYTPFDDLESADCASTHQFLKIFGDIGYERDCLPGHIVPIAMIINPERTKTLLAHHNLAGTFAQLGGHMDGERDCLKVVLKEITEESGLKNIKLLNNGKLFDVHLMRIARHMKKGKLVPHHLHYDPVYLFEANESDALTACEGENTSVQWIANEDIIRMTNEPDLAPIYNRLIQKVKLLKS